MGFLEKRKVQARRRANPRREMTFLEHLGELRGRLIICATAILLTTIIAGVFLGNTTFKLLKRPFDASKDKFAQAPTGDVLKLEIRSDGTVVALNPEILKSEKSTSGTVRTQGSKNGQNEEDTSGTVAAENPETSETNEEKSSRKIDRITIVGPDGSEWSFGGEKKRPGVIATTMFGPFLTLIKVAIILGIVFAIPIWLWQVWLFVAPAFKESERRVVRPVLLSGIVLFPIGVLFAYGMFYLIMPFALRYAEQIMDVQLMPDIKMYMNFVLNFMLAMGLVFETPLVILLLVRMGVVSTQTLKKSRSFVVVIICLLSAILTPSDPISMVAMAVPMLLLFEISLFVSTIVERKIQAADRDLT